MITWNLTNDHINDLQVEDVDAIIKRAKQAHFVDINIRINGKWEKYEGDWIKHIERISTPEERIEEIRAMFAAPDPNCPEKNPRNGCHLVCCGEACEGEGCINCGPDV